METNVLIIIITILLFIYIKHVRNRRKAPPGPLGFPFLGLLPYGLIQILFSKYLPEISQEKYFQQMKRKFGNIWSSELGSQRIVVLASLDVIKEAFIENGKLFAGRPIHEIYKLASDDCGIMFVDGELWQENRHLAIKALRDLGMGKKDLENRICEEANVLIEVLEKTSSQPINSSDAILKAVSNVISLLSFNERNPYNDPAFESYVENIKTLAHSNVPQNTIILFPKFFQTKFARKLFPKVDHYLQCNTDSIQFINNKCKSRIEKQNKNPELSCVFDYFWLQRHENNPNMKFEEKFKNISHSLNDLFSAGIDTTTNMLAFCCLILGKYEDLQNDLRLEIQNNIDDYKNITMDMRKNCPKLLSFIDEVQRYCYLVPILHHRVMKECVFKGYKIMPNDIVLGDLFSLSRDETLFVDPNTFNAYRFMDNSKTNYIPNKSLIPFGIGKRACLGQSIAMMELFLFLSKIIQRFHISLPSETFKNFNKIFEGHAAVVHASLDHEIIFTTK